MDIDVNGDNKIDRSELKRALGKFRVELTPSELDRIYDRFDADRNGYMNYKEVRPSSGMRDATLVLLKRFNSLLCPCIVYSFLPCWMLVPGNLRADEQTRCWMFILLQ